MQQKSRKVRDVIKSYKKMLLTETKKNVFLGVLTGALVGFVLGIVFGKPGSDIGTGEGNASGDIAKMANIGKFTDFPAVGEETVTRDTVRYEAVDEEGKSMEILIIK